jgi:hypothetical protein
MEIVHLKEPLSESRPPEFILGLLGIFLNGLMVDVFIHIEGKGQILLNEQTDT